MAMYKKEMLQKMKMPSMKPKERPGKVLELEISSDEAPMKDEEMSEESPEMEPSIDLTSLSDDELMAEVQKRGLMT